jgi:hypothetical protein
MKSGYEEGWAELFPGRVTMWSIFCSSAQGLSGTAACMRVFVKDKVLPPDFPKTKWEFVRVLGARICKIWRQWSEY